MDINFFTACPTVLGRWNIPNDRGWYLSSLTVQFAARGNESISLHGISPRDKAVERLRPNGDEAVARGPGGYDCDGSELFSAGLFLNVLPCGYYVFTVEKP